MVLAYIGWVVRRYMSAGPRQRGGSRVAPRPPAGVHAPGPSYAPVLAAIGLFVFFYGLVFRGWELAAGTIILVLTLLYWLREGIHDYDHLVHADATGVAVVPHQPPPGVHLPGPSFRPILVSIALAVLFYGLVFGGWLLLAGVLMLAISLLGWLADARTEYRAVVVADATGHLVQWTAPALSHRNPLDVRVPVRRRGHPERRDPAAQECHRRRGRAERRDRGPGPAPRRPRAARRPT